MRMHPPDVRLRKLLTPTQGKQDPVQEHVSGCAKCLSRVETLKNQPVASAYDVALTVHAPRLRYLQAAYDRERAEAKGLIAELLRHPSERQQILVRNHSGFHTWGVFESLLELSYQETARRSPLLGESLADLALDLSEHLDTNVYGAQAIEDLRGRAWAYIGNARRVRADLRGSLEAFDHALVHLRRGTREPWERAVCLSLRASLLRAQRRFDEAIRLLKRSLVLFRAVGDRHWIGLTLLSLDNVFHHAGQPEKGIPLLYEALKHIDSVKEPRLLLLAEHNLSDDLADAGQYMEAQRHLIKARPLYRSFNEPWIRHRYSWVEGKVARGLGQPDRAEEFLLAARAGFLEMSSPYDVALVSLDLAGLYAEQGRTLELKWLAEKMVPIFSSLQIQRETLAAFTLWQQAVHAETVGTELTARVASSLKRARYEQPPSDRETI